MKALFDEIGWALEDEATQVLAHRSVPAFPPASTLEGRKDVPRSCLFSTFKMLLELSLSAGFKQSVTWNDLFTR